MKGGAIIKVTQISNLSGASESRASRAGKSANSDKRGGAGKERLAKSQAKIPVEERGVEGGSGTFGATLRVYLSSPFISPERARGRQPGSAASEPVYGIKI